MTLHAPQTGSEKVADYMEAIRAFDQCETGTLRLMVIDLTQRYMQANGFIQGPFDFNELYRQSLQALMRGDFNAVKAHLAEHPGKQPKGMLRRDAYIMAQVALMNYLIKLGMIHDESMYTTDYAELFENLTHPDPNFVAKTTPEDAEPERATRSSVFTVLAN